MADPSEAMDFSCFHDQLFNHMLSVNIYTPLCMFFTLSDNHSKDQIVGRLRAGLEKLSLTFPWMTGQVVKADDADGHSRGLRLIPMDTTCRLIVKDYTDELPSMTDFEQAGFPVHMIDGEMFTSLTGMPNARPGESCPAFFAQANFIKGGLVISFAGEHSTMDGHGTGQAIRLFQKACDGISFSQEELAEGNRIRGITVPLLQSEAYRPGSELDYLVRKTVDPNQSSNDIVMPKCSWAYVHFSSSDMSELKSLASASEAVSTKPGTSPTTNDAVTAFTWQSIIRARIPRFETNATSTLGRAVDVRSALSISSLYLGNMSNHVYTTLPASSLVSMPLRSVAILVRSALSPESVAYGIQSLATYLAKAEDKSLVHYGANMDFSRDIFLSSWARLSCYQYDLGLGLGKPLSVRRPGFMAIEGLTYLLPVDNSGGITAMVCLRDEDLATLKADVDFAKYSTWIG